MIALLTLIAASQAAGSGTPARVAVVTPAPVPPVPATPVPTPAPQAVATPRSGFYVAPAPISTATPALLATPGPRGNTQLVLPPVPALPSAAPGPGSLPSGAIAGNAEQFVGLSLQDAIGMALGRNTDLAVSQANRRIAGYQIVAAQGAYDLRLQIQPSYEYQQNPPLSPFATGPNGTAPQIVTASANAQVTQLTSTGGRIQASTSASRIDNTTLFNNFNPYYETFAQLIYTQPLARGLAIDQNREQLQLARINASLSTDNALLTASNTIDNVSVAYNNLVAAWKNVAIQEDALRQAKLQSESNSRLVRQGQAAPVDVVQSDEQVNEFQDQIYSAVQNVATYQNQLKQLILNDPADPAWIANLVPTTPIGAAPAEPALGDVIVAALTRRPEAAQIRDNLRSQDVTVAFDRDQTKPQIDLNIGVTQNGLAGAPENLSTQPLFSVIGQQTAAINELIARANAAGGGPPLVPINANGLVTTLPPNSVGNIGTSYKSLLAGQYPTYQISATVGFPLRDRTAMANYDAALEQRRSLVTQEVALVQRFQTESRNAVQAYRSARSRLIAAGAARVASEKVAASELRKFKAGASTTYLVLQRQIMLANSRNRELQAQTDVQNALVELDRVSGDILSRNGVDVNSLGTAPQGAVPFPLHK